MKTKNFKLILKLIAIPSILVFTVLTASANYGSFGNPSNSPKPNCAAFHNAGYTGATPPYLPSDDYPNGTPFPTFNGYRDQETVNGREFDERQFAYLELSHANGNGQFPRHNGVQYHPWQSQPIPQYNFNAPQATQYDFQFTNNSNDKYYVGVWGYMHNNGTKDTYLANNVKIKLTGFNDTTPQLVQTPKYTITADDSTCPESVWADVEIGGNKAFTLDLNEFYVYREAPPGSPESVKYEIIKANSTNIQNLTTTGLGINSRSGLSGGSFESSETHWVAVYAEFEVVPEEAGVCRNLTITDPNQTLVNVDENGFNDRNLEFTVDTDPNTVTGYRLVSTEGSIEFNNSGQSDYELNGENQTQAVMDGGPSDPNSPDTVQVWALDNNGNEISNCFDSFVVQRQEEQAPVCEVFGTNPGSLGSQQVDIGVTTIELEGPLDNNGDPYRPNNQIPNIRYCYTNDGITFMPDSGNVVHPGGNLRCAVAPLTDPMVIDTTQTGTMTIEVVGAEDDCNDMFKTDFEFGGKCELLEFVQDEFNIENRTEYCVILNVEPTVQGYNNHIQWEVERDGNSVFSEDTTNTLCIDLDNYNYDFQPGDVLTAQALDINYDGNDCEDKIASEELVCEDLSLDKNHFERGKDNKICIDDIDPNDWPINSTGVEVSIDGDDSIHLDVDDDCFVIDENLLEDADEIEVWVDGYEDDCAASLTREVQPPTFSKNVKDQDGAVFAHRAIANWTDEKVFYQIKYEHKDDVEQDVTITDTIGVDDYIQGYIADVNDSDLSNNEEGGRIYYDDGSMNVYVEGEGNIENCDNTSGDLCYYGDIGSSGGVTVKNVPPRREVVVSYTGNIVDSAVNPSNCSKPDGLGNDICGEIYPNTSEFEDETPFSGRDKAEVVIPCPFFIIRSGGEVFMENPFDYGVDTLACSEIENVPSPFIVPDYTPPQTTPSTGAPEGIALIKALDDRLCKSASAQEAGYGDVSRASSLICEVTLKTSEELTQYVISQNIQRNIDLFARYDKDLNNRVSVNGSNDLPSNTSNVFVKDNGDLELSGTFGDGAQTIVVLNNDVIITGNIKLDDSSANLSDPRTIPSLAVIVIGGNIRVQPNVTETNGVFFVMENAEGNGGQMCEKDCKDDDVLSRFNDKQYVHYGSIYGDIQHLFKYRTFAGDPTKLEAAVLIKFDSRIFLNTPPLLNELINVSQQVF